MSKPLSMPPAESLWDDFQYKPLTGELVSRKTGRVVGHRNYKGYVLVYHKGRDYRRSRLVWQWLHGNLDPSTQIDHVNRCKNDDRPWNLRKASPQQNRFNEGIRKSNTSGRKGVSFDRSRGKWSVKICMNGRTVNLGRFCELEEAGKAYDRAAQALHGCFVYKQ